MANPIRLDAVARVLQQLGYSFIPVLPDSKATQLPKWSRFCNSITDSDTSERWLREFPHYGVGIVCGPVSVVGIDIDCIESEKASAIKALVTRHVGETIVRVGQAPKMLLPYRVDGETIRKRKIGKVDILGAGSYFVAFGVHPSTSRPYQWIDGSPLDTPLADLPLVTAEQIEGLCDELLELQGLAMPDQRTRRSCTNAEAATCSERDLRSGLVIDSRDQHLTQLVWAAFCRGGTTAEAIADDAWKAFVLTTDLSRPKKDGNEPWIYADALAKARYVLQSGKPRIGATIGAEAFWTEAHKREFASFVALYVAQQRLPRSLVAVSNSMLGFLLGNDVCCASVDTLAKLSRLEPDSLKAVRRKLVLHQLWAPSNNLGGAYRTAEYRPVRDCVNGDPRKLRR